MFFLISHSELHFYYHFTKKFKALKLYHYIIIIIILHYSYTFSIFPNVFSFFPICFNL